MLPYAKQLWKWSLACSGWIWVGCFTAEEKRALQFAGRVFLALAGNELASALQSGVLLEVRCDEQTH
jgi:hypothetical protein